MHCNERDHTVAWLGAQEKRLGHVIIEVDNLDDVGLTHDIVRHERIPVDRTLGKHANDHMFSFYFRPPPDGWSSMGGEVVPPRFSRNCIMKTPSVITRKPVTSIRVVRDGRRPIVSHETLWEQVRPPCCDTADKA